MRLTAPRSIVVIVGAVLFGAGAMSGQDSTVLARGRLAYAAHRSDDAIAWFEKLVAAEPDSAMSHVWLGRAYVQALPHASFLKQPLLARRARSQFDRAIELDPRNVDAHADRATYYMYAPSIAGGGIDKARAESDVVRSLNAYRGGLLRAEIELHDKNLPGVEAEYAALAAAYPDSAAPFNGLLGAYQSTHRYADAFAAIDRRRAARPDDPWADFQLGKTASLSGERLEDGERALRHYLDAAHFAPGATEAQARYRLGMILEQRHDAAAARGEYEAAVRLEPGMDQAKQALRRLP